MADVMEPQIAQIETILAQMIEEHDHLDRLLQRKRDALRVADHAQVAACTAQENQRVQAIAELEKRRMMLVGDVTLALDPGAQQPMSLRDVAERLSEPVRGRLLVRRQELRQRMIDVRQRAGVVQRATEALSQHMHGLMQTISGAVTGPGCVRPRGPRGPRQPRGWTAANRRGDQHVQPDRVME